MDKPAPAKPNSIDRLLRPEQVRQLEYVLFDLEPPLTNALAAAGSLEFWGVTLSESAIARFYRRTDRRRLYDARRERAKPRQDGWSAFLELVEKHTGRPGYRPPTKHLYTRPRGGYESSITKALSEEQQAALARWLLDERMVCSAAVERLHREFSVKFSESAVRRFLKRGLKWRAYREAMA